MTPADRQLALMEWLAALPDRNGLTTQEITNTAVTTDIDGGPCFIYAINCNDGRVLVDLLQLEHDHRLFRGPGRPTTWWTSP